MSPSAAGAGRRGSGGDDQAVEVAGRRILLRNLDKVMYPITGTTKGEVLSYVAAVAEAMLPHLRDRPVTRMRWPHGVEGPMFVEKNMPLGSPDWLRRVVQETPGSSSGNERIVFPLMDDLAGLVWAANLAALELHVPQWRVGPRGGVRKPDRLVIDLDPGVPAGLAECAEVALMVRERLLADGLDPIPVTSGGKGLQLYAAIAARQDADVVRDYARRLAESLERKVPALVVARMTRSLRSGRVLLDWSQNHAGKTTVAPYSLRGRQVPTVAAPRRWAEIDAGLSQIGPDDIVTRLAGGDLLAPVLSPGPRLPT